MFSRQTITKDPISVTPSVFNIMLLIGLYSYPVAINVAASTPVLDSTSWHVRETISLDGNNPELLLIPWIAEAVGTITTNLPELTDSLLLGNSVVNISIVTRGFTTDTVDLAPSWYIREPSKTLFSFPYTPLEHFDSEVAAKYVQAAIKNAEEIIIPWGEINKKSPVIESAWNFLERLDQHVISSYEEFSDKFISDIAQTYSSPSTKDLEEIVPWGKFDDQYSNSLALAYFAPNWKDKEHSLPFDAFRSEFGNTFDLFYSHPAPKDVEKTIWCGPNWFPKWCIYQYAPENGMVIFNAASRKDLAYEQYFASQAFGINSMGVPTLPDQFARYPQPIDMTAIYPSGRGFSFGPIGSGVYNEIRFAGATGGTLTTKTDFLVHPIYMDGRSDVNPLVCYDGYRTGPKDSTDRVPYYPYTPTDYSTRKAYIIMNSVSVKRVSDNAIIPILDISIGTDLDSWCWTIQANLRRKVDLALVTPVGGVPVEILVTINGNTWKFVVEDFGETRSFGQRNYAITGKSTSAYLAEPYAAPVSSHQAYTINAAQVAEEVVANTGFTIDWQLADWLIPANVYSVSQQTPMQQLITIANAAGGVVQSAQNTAVVSMLPWYKTVPWGWGGVTVDAILPTFQERSTSYKQQTLYNGVYVGGANDGLTVLITRSGSNGASQPQMVTDPLITAPEVGLARGSKILADSGTRSIESISVPLLDNPGALKPGWIIDVVEDGVPWRGMVVSTTIAAQRPTVHQSLEVLRYYGG